MQEQWIRWEPVAGLSEKYSIVSITGKIEGFWIILSSAKPEGKSIRLEFLGTPESYQTTDIHYMSSRMNKLQQQYGATFFTEWTFFKVLNSEYAKWVSDESFGFIQLEGLLHVVLIGTNSIVDMITPSEPQVIFKEGY